MASPKDIIPLPKIKIERKHSGKGLKSVLLTLLPNKEWMENETKEKEKLATEKEKRAKEIKEHAKVKEREKKC